MQQSPVDDSELELVSSLQGLVTSETHLSDSGDVQRRIAELAIILRSPLKRLPNLPQPPLSVTAKEAIAGIGATLSPVGAVGARE